MAPVPPESARAACDPRAPQRPGEDLRLGEGLCIPAAELQWRFSRSAGPGGQNVNTTDSRVELVFSLARSRALPPKLRARALERLGPRLVDGALVIAASEHRSQWRNRVAARRRLLALLQEALRPPPPPRRATRPTRAAVERRLAAKQRRGALKRGRSGQRPSPDD
ncbi:MAG: alternative ribosome rescue aminoacyl-tRNA hydrolase ArfB [Synechococcaceae cyanobacterium]